MKREVRDVAASIHARLLALARLGKARIPTQIDLGFGDAVVPGPVDLCFPVLLDHPAPNVRAYPVESVVAEKLESFLDRAGITEAPRAFPEIGVVLRAFLTPVLDAASGEHSLMKRWRDGAWS
jgi:hypothetical protein